MSNILVTGTTGHFGKATIDFLLKKGVSPNTSSTYRQSTAIINKTQK